MKNAAITLRLSAELARHLAKIARGRGVPKSQVVREAVARYLEPTVSQFRTPVVTAGFLAERWKDLPALTSDEARDFTMDLETARNELPALTSDWK